jgi:heat shock protein HtpX
MATITPVTQPVLVYDRIAQNRLQTVLLVALTIALTIPFITAMSYGVSEVVVSQLGGGDALRLARERAIERTLTKYRQGNGSATEYGRLMQSQLEQDLATLRSENGRSQSAFRRFRFQVMLVTGAAVSGLLLLMFWAFASSPTSKILSMSGARPAGPAEAEVKRLVENLAVGAGLPPPKLYVIDSPWPNAFSAGPDPQGSVVTVTQGLIQLLDQHELEGVIGHELSHIGNHDTRLNTVVAALALFLRFPYLLLKRRIASGMANHHEYIPYRRRAWYRWLFTVAMIPCMIYVFVVAPILAAIIRSAISRSREFLADADGVLLTRQPDALMRALAKIGGAGSVVASSNPVISHLYFADPAKPGGAMGVFRGNLLSSHPPIDQRIQSLAQFGGGAAPAGLEQAVRDGAEFAKNRPQAETDALEPLHQDELSALNAGNPMGRVFRVLASTEVYDQPNRKSAVVSKLAAGDLVVVFDDPGVFRQVVTADQTFGYMPRAVKLQKVDLLPAEMHDPEARAMARNAIPHAAPATAATCGLSGKQMAIAAALGLIVFAGIFLVMLQIGGK